MSHHHSLRHKLIYRLSLGLWLLVATSLPGYTAQVDNPAPVFLPAVTVTRYNADGRPSWSAPLALSTDERQLWVVNADAGSVSVVDVGDESVLAEIAVGAEPAALVLAPNGDTVYVINTANGTLSFVDTQRFTVTATVALGPEPAGIALSPTGRTAYVTLSAADEIAVVDVTARRVVDRVAVAAKPHAIAVTDDGDGEDGDETIIVTHFWARQRADGEQARDDGSEGVVSRIAAADHSIHEIVLPPNANGFPNLLAGVTLHDDLAWLPHLRAAPDAPVGLTTTLFAAVSTVDLTTRTEALDAYLPLNDQEIFGSPVNNPVAAIPSPDGARLYVVLAGSDLVEVIDVADRGAPRLVRFLATGRNPQGMAITQDSNRGYVLNALSRSVTVMDLAALTPLSEIVVTAETLDAATLRGKILFNLAADPRLSQGSWISCASCHPSGGADGVSWIFPDGIRQTPPLWNATQTLPWHWSAALDEAQDVETTIEEIQHGVGLAPGATDLLGAPLAERSTDLDALATYLERGIRPPTLPTALDQTQVERGRLLFVARGCHGCHGGAAWTSSRMPGAPGSLDADGNGMVDAVLRDVGTLNPRDVRGHTGFDPPSLLGVGLTAPYFHDGSMPTLADLLVSGHPTPDTADPPNKSDLADLVAFLRSIDATTPPIDSAARGYTP
jgi:YVTN family beta-propeller protein